MHGEETILSIAFVEDRSAYWASTRSTDHRQYRGFDKEVSAYVDELSVENPRVLSREVERLVRQICPQAIFLNRGLLPSRIS